MIKVYRCYSNPSRMDRLVTSTRNAMESISKLVGKIAEDVTYLILTTVAMVVPVALWLGIPSAVFMYFDFPVDTQWKAFAILGAVAAWTVLCFLVGVYLCRPGKPYDKNH